MAYVRCAGLDGNEELAPFCVEMKAKSVIAAAVIHGSLNGTAGLATVVVKGGDDLLVGVSGLAGFIVLAVINIAIFAYERLVCRVGSAHQLPGRVLPAYYTN